MKNKLHRCLGYDRHLRAHRKQEIKRACEVSSNKEDLNTEATGSSIRRFVMP